MIGPRVLVSVVAWNDARHTAACVESLLGRRAPEIDVVLVDNGSRPETAGELRALAARWGSALRLVRSERNVGFAAGHALALATAAAAAHTHVLLLNNDAVADAEVVLRLVAEAERADADVAGPAIAYAARPDRVWQGGGRVVDLLCHLRSPWMGRPVAALPREPLRVDFVSGCAMLLRTSFVARVGFLDAAHFYSVEDWDLCTRARRAGARVVFVPSCVVLHHVSAAAGGWRSRFSVLHQLWGRARYVTRHGRPRLRWPAWAFLVLVVLPGKALRTTDAGALRVLREGLRAIRLGAAGRPAEELGVQPREG